MSNLRSAVAFIVDEASEQDLDAILNAYRARDRVLKAMAAARVEVGMTCRLDGLSPKYLNGLTGVVHSITGTRAVVTLDPQSTTRLSRTPTRFYISPGETTYDLMGVPLSSIKAA